MSKTIHVLDKRLALHQPEDGFKTSIDAVLLAAACQAKALERVLDLGCGVGSAALCLALRIKDLSVTGIDIQNDHIKMANENARLNDLTAHFITSDIRSFEGKPYDHIICNPPYHAADAHVRSPSEAKAKAMGHMETTLQDWLDAGCKLLKHGGTLTMIHKAEETDLIIRGFLNRFGRVELIPIYPKLGKIAARVIIRATRNSKTGAIIHPGLILHKEDGSYTTPAENILRDMAAIH